MKRINFYHDLPDNISVTACDQAEIWELSSSDYIIFGHFYGECMGEQCRGNIFRFRQDKLFEDTKDEFQKANHFL